MALACTWANVGAWPTLIANTTLSNVMSTGTNTRSTMTMTVTSDPCNRFGTSGVLTWIKVL